MASTDFAKKQVRSLARMGKHFEQELREKLDHTNQDIDKNMTALNYTIGSSSFKESVERLKARTAAVDAVLPPTRLRKDRVTAIMVYTPCPKEIERMGRSDEFFTMVHKNLEERFGAANVHGTFVHKDEVHSYRDKDGSMRESLEHSHSVVSPYVPGKGINGKEFLRPAMMREFHRDLDQRVYETFGVHMLTGDTPEHKRVEQLKVESAMREQIERGKMLRASFERLENDYKRLEVEIADIPTWERRKLQELLTSPEAVKEAVDSYKGLVRPDNELIERYLYEHKVKPLGRERRAALLGQEQNLLKEIQQVR